MYQRRVACLPGLTGERGTCKLRTTCIRDLLVSPTELIRRIEETSMSALPALKTIYYDGWVLRFANGYTRRSNSINPLYSSTLPIEDKIDYCERTYDSLKQNIAFKLTDAAIPGDLETQLIARGYEHGPASPVSIQLCELTDLKSNPGVTVVRSETLSKAWQTEFFRMNGVSEDHYHTMRAMLNAIVPRTCCFSIETEDSTVACGFAVQDGQYVGLFDIVTDPNHRRRGLGQAITLDMMKWGKDQGASTAYLQVVADNKPAIELYKKIGFEEAYKYWYRVREHEP
jgi:ribosomal protein S18 acetylase RimI-like enzyme